MSETPQTRSQWGSKVGFVLAAAGSAVGLGNLWKFPYITGENGGGAFVLIYLVCIVVVGLPIMVAEVLLGKETQKSPVGAFASHAPHSAWRAVGWLGVAGSFVILSYYSVVAGWAMHYVGLALGGAFTDVPADQISAIEGRFGALYADPQLNVLWHTVFMALTVGVVQVLFLFNLAWSLFKGKPAGANPWNATSLEWLTPDTPPVHGNWGAKLPVVHRWAYDYSVPGIEQDFVPQTVSDEELAHWRHRAGSSQPVEPKP